MTTATLDPAAPSLRATASATRSTTRPGFVSAGLRVMLRLEGLAMLVAAIAGYRALGGTWGFFAATCLLPDLSLLGYLAGPTIGAIAYNTGHSLLGPLLLAGAGLLAGSPMALSCTLIWVAHIGFDRALGYGLKYTSAFGDTHLGRVGHAPPAA